MTKIIPHLWYTDNAEEAASFLCVGSAEFESLLRDGFAG
jgi:hypothetical protein